MRKLTRPLLPSTATNVLARLSARVSGDENPATRLKTAARLWKNKRRAKASARAFDDVYAALLHMTGGRGRCMYCEDSFGTDIEHFWPKATYPKRTFEWNNYLLACSHCNSNLKRSQFPFKNGRPSLLNPSVDDPALHLVFVPSNGEFSSIGPKGQPSIDVFGLNDRTTPRRLPDGRKSAFIKLQLLLLDYDSQMTSGRYAEAAETKRVLLDEPFSTVLGWLVSTARADAGSALLRSGVGAAVMRHGVDRW